MKSVGLRFAMNLPRPLQRLLVVRPVRRDGLTLAPEVQILLALQRLVREPAVETLPVTQAREALVRQSQMVAGRQPVGAIRDLFVDGGEGRRAARLYTTSSRLGADPVPTLLYLHGGGWVYGDLESHDPLCRHLAEHARIQVLAVDYRLAPEHPFPAAVEDAVAAYRWLVAHADEVNADPSRLAVGGDSAGGNLSAVVALTAAREGLPLRHQMLIYPATDFAGRTESRRLFADGFFLTERFMDQCEEMYAAAHDRTDPLLSPLRTADVPSGVAPALIVTAGFDPLRDEGEAYAALLRSHGVPVELIRYGGLIHGFFNMVGLAGAGHAVPAATVEIAEKVGAVLG